MHRNRLILNPLFVILILCVAACGEKPPAVSTRTSSLPAAIPTTSMPPVNPATSLLFTPTPTPAPRPEPTLSPQVIEPANAGQVVELARLGKGTIQAQPIYAPEGMPVFSPDGLWMAIPTSAGIYIYDPLSLEEQHRINVGTAFIAFSPDGSLLAVSERSAVSLWNPTTGIRMGELPGNPDDYYWELIFSSDGTMLSAASSHREITIWSLESHERLFTFSGDRVRFSPAGDLAVVVGYGENRVHLYETRSRTEVSNWSVANAGFSPGGQLWLEDNISVRLAYLDRDLMTAPFTGIQPSFSADGTLMSLFANGHISLYDQQRGRRTQILEGNYVHIDGVLFSPNGQTLAGDVYTLHCPTCSEADGLDRSLVLWRAVDGSIITRIEHPAGWIGYSTDGTLLAALQIENVQLLIAAEGLLFRQLDGFTAPVEGMALAPDGRTLAAGYATNPYTLHLWNLESSSVDRTLQGQAEASPGINLAMAYSPDGEYLAVRGDLWNLTAGAQLSGVEQAISAVTSCWSSCVAFAPESNTLATGCFQGQLDLWSIPDGGLLKRIDGYSSWVEDLVYSPDGNSIAAAYGVPDYLVQIWQLPQGTASFTLTGGHFTQVRYSPNGYILATIMAADEYDQYGMRAGFVQLWSASDGKELTRVDVGDAVSIAFSPDSQILATGSLDGTLRLWEIAGGRLLMEASGHYRQIQQLVFTPDGINLVSGSSDGTIIRWGIPGRSLP